MSEISYWDYEFTWSYLKALIEEFNEKWPTYYFYIEPFLEVEFIDIVGVFNDYGLIIFFILDKSHKGSYIIEKNKNSHVIPIRINPDILIKKNELEILLITESINFFKKLKGES